MFPSWLSQHSCSSTEYGSFLLLQHRTILVHLCHQIWFFPHWIISVFSHSNITTFLLICGTWHFFLTEPSWIPCSPVWFGYFSSLKHHAISLHTFCPNHLITSVHFQRLHGNFSYWTIANFLFICVILLFFPQNSLNILVYQCDSVHVPEESPHHPYSPVEYGGGSIAIKLWPALWPLDRGRSSMPDWTGQTEVWGAEVNQYSDQIHHLSLCGWPPHLNYISAPRGSHWEGLGILCLVCPTPLLWRLNHWLR